MKRQPLNCTDALLITLCVIIATAMMLVGLWAIIDSAVRML